MNHENEVHKQMNLAYLGGVTVKPEENYDQMEYLELHKTLHTLQKQMRSCFAKDLAPMGQFVEVAIRDLVETYMHANDRKFNLIAWRYISTRITESLFSLVPRD